MSRNIRTLRDFGDDDNAPDSDDSGADVERSAPQELYVGSGQAVQGPRGPRAPHGPVPEPEAHIRRILQAAEVANPEDPGQRGKGGGRGKDTVTLTLHLWTDGLSIEDGPLMARQDPATIEFLESVGKGEIPPSLHQQYPGKEIDFNIDRRHESYRAPKMRPFGGSGVRLGNVVPNIVGESSSSSGAQSSSVWVDKTLNTAEVEARQLEEAKKELNTNMKEPTTNIQIRLPNNQRLVGVFNHSHTLEAVRSFVCTARPDMIYAPFQMMCAYPPKILDDESQTVKDANLLNSVIAVRVQPNF